MSSSSLAGKRIQSLLDANSFVEIGAKVKARATDFNMAPQRKASDGVITGYGLIDGRLVYVYSQDAEILGGSIGEMHAKKIVQLYGMALRTGAPVIALIDSSGIRLQEGIDALDAFGSIYSMQARASGIIPQICAVFGSCGGGLAVSAAMSDFILMEKEARLFVNAPNAIAGNHEEGCDTARAENRAAAGNVDFVGTQDEILGRIRYLFSILPSNNDYDADRECGDDMNRSCPGAASLTQDPRAALCEIADGGRFFEVKRDHAKEMFAALTRLGGTTVGIIANSAGTAGGAGKKSGETAPALTAAGCRKAARFVRFCDAFEIPIITLTNASGFSRTRAEEEQAAEAAAGLVAAFACATVPRINVITKRAGGSAYAVMNCKALGTDLAMAYEDATVGILEGKAAARILCDGTAAEVEKAAKEYDALQNSIEAAAERGSIDQIIAACDVRKYLIGAVEVLYSKREALPSRKHAAI